MSQQAEVADEPTGERFIPELMAGQLIDAEHRARYRFALPHVAGKRVLDAGCGVGWGSELIVDAGAAAVVGLDISVDAIEASRARGTEASFVEGDLQQLPFPDASFDVVVCFEALEHTPDTRRTLDELVRVLAPGGLLFVSSPNPAVYPAGNPFHLEELPPDELRAATAERLGNVALFRQHQHVSSLLYPDTSGAGETSFLAEVYPVAAIEPGHDPYSVVVASDGPLPELEVVQTLAPSTQLDNLGALAAALSEEREALHAEHARITAEWSSAAAALQDAQGRLREAGDTIAGLMGERDDAHRRLSEAGETIRGLMSERDAALQTVTDLGTRVQALTGQLERQRLVADNAARERDEVGMRLIQAQQRLATERDPFTPRVDAQSVAGLHQRLDELSGRVVQRENDIETIKATLSWRVTRPLRRARTVLGRAIGG